jgi:hypothetical protein
MSQSLTSSESRAITLLGQGINPEMAAAAVGLSVSRISQLLSQEEHATAVAEARYKNLVAHSARDAKYDDLEDKLIKRLSDVLVFMTRPMEILAAIKTINGAKRRGASAPESLTTSQETVPLTMPVAILQQFSVNINNQVIKVGEKDLTTVQSGQLSRLLESRKIENVQITHSPGVANA